MRAVLEVLKLSDPSDLLLHLSSVCLQWRKLSTNSEVWQAYCEYDDIDLNNWREVSAQEAYRLSRYPYKTTLVHVQNSTVKLVSIPDLPDKAAISEYTLTTNSGLSDENGYCLISVKRLFRFGVKELTNVQNIDLAKGTITPLPPMSVPRHYPGVLRYSPRLIYLFGGRTQVCEKFHIQSKQWERVNGEMIEPLEALMPALYNFRVFLAGHTTVEVFDIHEETFRKLPFDLPIDWWYTICLIVKDELVVVQNSVVSRWAIDSAESAFREITWEGFGSGYYSNCPPVWYNGELYSLFNNVPSVEGLLAFSPSQNTLRRVLERF